MKYSDFHKTDILIRYLGKETNEAENKLVEEWCEESQHNRDHLLKIKSLWDDSIDRSILDDKYQTRTAYENLFAKKFKAPVFRLNYKIIAAATVALLFGVGLLAYFLWFNGELKVQTGNEVASITLKDNSKIWLNKNSNLTYRRYQGKDRLVKLSGEAYFEVAPDATRPFIIITGNSKITVVGTSFNVKAYPGKSETEVSVTSGVVMLNHLVALPAQNMEIKLSAGERGLISRDSIPVKEPINDLNFNSWKTRDFVFDNTNIVEIIDLANSIYGTDIQIESNNVEKCNITGTFKCQSIDEMLDMLGVVLNVTIQHKGNHIYIRSDSCLVNE